MFIILPVALFEAWRVGNAIPDANIPSGGRNTKNYKAQQANANLLLRRHHHAHDLYGGDLNNMPGLEYCASSRNPREYYTNVMRYCIACNGLFQHRLKQQEIADMTSLLELVGITFTEMNVHLPPSFHRATHIGDHLQKFGNVYGTGMYNFERANRVKVLQAIEGPTADDTATTNVLLGAMRNAPEHEL
ncbi:hypothetical protein FRC10_007334 [Ceratobasidium sp. 414]|nr:hypothetical protein FRC10_007334 [Ceratobasidium sp. 414]